jgi:hypothetical protein
MLTVLLSLLLAQAAGLDSALDRLAAVTPGDGASYVAAREKVLAFGKDAISELAVRSGPERWTEAGWVRALAAESCRLRLADPDLAAAVDRPEGLDPARYRLFRHGEPTILASLAKRGAGAVPLLIERWRWTFDLLAYSEGAAGDKERETLRNAILALPGRVSDTRARHFLSDVLGSTDLRDAWRGGAAVSLGVVGGLPALPRLTGLLDDTTLSSAVREACARALGRIPDPSALEAIRTRLANEKDAQVRRSFVQGLGILGSAWGWESRGKEVASVADAVRAGCAETLVEAILRHPAEAETLGVALAMTAWEPSLKSVESLAGDATASADVKTAAESILPKLRLALSRRR